MPQGMDSSLFKHPRDDTARQPQPIPDLEHNDVSPAAGGGLYVVSWTL